MRTTGFPTSANGASSFHLWWEPHPPVGNEVSVVVVVDAVPDHDHLVFWALQVEFVSRMRSHGGAHLGLQWNRRHPDRRAVNWGGYRHGGMLLEGSASPLPSTPGDPNTRDLAWETGVPYRLAVRPGTRRGWWAASVTDVRSGVEWLVRELAGGGSGLARPVVWSEVFARCDDPPVSVTWSDPGVRTGDGRWSPTTYRVSYQPEERGGCTNTTVMAVEGGVRQLTSRERIVPDGATIAAGGIGGQGGEWISR